MQHVSLPDDTLPHDNSGNKMCHAATLQWSKTQDIARMQLNQHLQLPSTRTLPHHDPDAGQHPHAVQRQQRSAQGSGLRCRTDSLR